MKTLKEIAPFYVFLVLLKIERNIRSKEIFMIKFSLLHSSLKQLNK